MFGTFRFVLALLVVLSHLSGAGLMHYAGLYAVRAFFVVSGFAVSGALNDVYRFDLGRFAINRFLRLMPCYLLVCGMTALAIALLPREAALFMPRWAFEPSAGAIVLNLVLVPLVFQAPDFRFIEPAWSMAVEVFMYALLFLGMARSPRGALMGLAFGVAFHVVSACCAATFALRYFSIPSAILGFSLGSTLFFYRHWLLERFGRLPVGPAAALLWGCNILIAGSVASGYGEGFGYYFGIALATLLVAVLANRRAGRNGEAIDRALGHLSYPIFLLQWLGGFVAHMLFRPDDWRSWSLAAVAIPIILVAAAAIAGLQFVLVEPLRDKFRMLDLRPVRSEARERAVAFSLHPAIWLRNRWSR